MASTQTVDVAELQRVQADADRVLLEDTQDARNQLRHASDVHAWAVADWLADPLNEHKAAHVDELRKDLTTAEADLTKALAVAKGQRTKTLKAAGITP